MQLSLLCKFNGVSHVRGRCQVVRASDKSSSQISCGCKQPRHVSSVCAWRQIDFLGEPTTGNLHLVQRGGEEGAAGGVHALGLCSMGDVFEAPTEQLRARQQVRQS